MLKSIFLISFLLLSFSGCYAGEVSRKEPSSGVLKEKNGEPYSWDFGQVKGGEVLKHSFTLKNETRQTLQVKDINTSCGCTVSQVKKKTLLPQEATEIEVQFDTKGYRGETTQHVYVHTDNLDNPVIMFIIKALVK